MPSRRNLLQSAAAMLLTPRLTVAGAENAVSSIQAAPSIIRKAIPSSGELIPVVGIGTNRYGVGSDPQALAPLQATLAEFAGLGGGVIDTAPMYGSSESVLGKLIHELDLRDRFFLATKCDVTGGLATSRQLASSAQKLMSNQLDLVAVHNLRNWQQQLPVLQDAKQAGEIRYVGVTTSRNRQHSEVMEILKTRQLDFVQVNYSLADRTAEQQLLPLAMEKNVAVMVNLPFARGRLFKAVEGLELPGWSIERGIDSWARFFLKFLVSHPAVSCVIPGTRKISHLTDNFGAAQGYLPDSEERTRMAEFFDHL